MPEGDTVWNTARALGRALDGAWRVYRPGQAWRGGPAHTIRAVLRTASATAVGFHLHDLALIPTADEPTLVGHLGPDLLGPDWDPDEAARRLAAHPDTAIAEALLDQTSLAGIGNLYKSEVLFLRGVSPWTPVRDVPDLPGLPALAHRKAEQAERVTYWCPACQPAHLV